MQSSKHETLMKFIECGNTNGNLVVYFHGTPGAPEECMIFDESAKKNNLRVVCFDRFGISKKIDGKKYYERLANEIQNIADSKTIDLIGFSIGCPVAIRVASILQKNVGTLHLISAAAPLEAGDFINKMAGKIVFKIAMNFPPAFYLLSYWQSFLSRVAPDLLYKMLFSSAKGRDKELSNNSEFKTFITPILKNCFSHKVNGYIREVFLYVKPWNHSLTKCKANTHIWHGENDNWAPVEMAHYLSESLSSCVNKEVLSGLSHYTCLYEVVPKVCLQLSNKT